MKKFHLILILLIVFFAPNVFAAEFNMNQYTSAIKNGTKNRYAGTEIMYTGSGSLTWTFNTRYDGKLNDIITYFSYPFEKNTTYRFTYNMATNDFNNNFSSSWWWDCDDDDPVAHVFVPTYISYKKVQYSITPSSNTTCIKVQLMGKSNGQGITQIKNWNLSSITIYDPDYQSGSGSGQGITPAATPNPNADIINNQNNNTQDIINNQNDNTADIISSIQETTKQVSETITNTFTDKCKNILDFSSFPSQTINGITFTNNGNGSITINGTASQTFGVNFIQFNINAGNYYLSLNATSTPPSPFYLYDYDSYVGYGNGAITLPQDFIHMGFDTYIQNGDTFNNITIYPQLEEGSSATSYCSFGSTESNKIDELNDKLDGISHIIEDAQVDDKSSFFTGFQDNSHGLTGIITAPLTTIQGLANKSCVPLSIPIPYTNSNVSLPCMTQVYQTYVPTVFNIWQVVSFGIISYFICIDIFKMVKGFKDPNEDKVEVLDL